MQVEADVAELLLSVDAKDVFCGEEFGMYWRKTENDLFGVTEATCESERMTVFACCSMLGEKLDLTVVGSSHELLDIINKPFLQCYVDNSAWMNDAIFIEVLERINEQMQLNQRFIVLCLSHGPAMERVRDMQYSNVRVVALSSGQSNPMREGIVQSIKGHYRLNLTAFLNQGWFFPD